MNQVKVVKIITCEDNIRGERYKDVLSFLTEQGYMKGVRDIKYGPVLMECTGRYYSIDDALKLANDLEKKYQVTSISFDAEASGFGNEEPPHR